MSRPGSLLKLEEDAYYAVLRALAVNDLDWVIHRHISDYCCGKGRAQQDEAQQVYPEGIYRMTMSHHLLS